MKQFSKEVINVSILLALICVAAYLFINLLKLIQS